MAAVMRSSVLPLLLALAPALLAVPSDAERAVSVIDVDVELDPAPPHLGVLAARGRDLEAFRTAVEANARNAGALLEVSSDLAMPKGWPKSWSGKLAGIPKVVGSGAFGQVFVVPLRCSKGSKVAVKKLEASKEEVEMEVASLRAFSDHPNFVSYFSHDKGSDGAYYIMMEAASGGELAKHLQSPHAGALFLGMLRGVKQMHDVSVVHRDLKPQNVLVSKACGGVPPCSAKVVDLGMACSMKIPSQREGVPQCDEGLSGTPLYMAPELYRTQFPNPSNDVWALGLILYELLFAELPIEVWFASTLEQLESAIKKFDISSDWNYKNLPDGEPKQLMEGMLRLDPKQRLSAAQALEIANAWGKKEKWGSTELDEVAKLPSCFKQEAQPEALSDQQENEEPATGELGGFVIKKPQSDIATIIFNEKLVERDGTVTAKIRETNKNLLGKASRLNPGDRILTVNGKPWTSVYDQTDYVDKMKSGLFGPLVFWYRPMVHWYRQGGQ